jgi:hypothetical protein
MNAVEYGTKHTSVPYDDCVNRKKLFAILTLVLIGGSVCWLGVREHRRREACYRRGAALQARVESLRERARIKLSIGAGRDSAMHFFTENGFHAGISNGEIEGTVSTDGCSPVGCGADAALIGMRVSIDASGTVASETHRGSDVHRLHVEGHLGHINTGVLRYAQDDGGSGN